jgi:hypothetical protein
VPQVKGRHHDKGGSDEIIDKGQCDDTFEAVRKHISGGLVDMLISMMKPCRMKTLMVIGWDWQHTGMKKHVPCEVLPSICGILQVAANT